MQEVLFEKKKFKNKTEQEIQTEIFEMGFSPIKFLNAPNYKYPKHRHIESKLLAFLKGKMHVQVNGELFECEPGDLLIIPGEHVHSAKVGDSGCDFFWSEKLTNTFKSAFNN